MLFGGALLLALTTPAQLRAQVVPLTFGSWLGFEFFNGAGFPIEGNGFSVASSTGQIRIRLTDAFFAGDAYDIFVNAILFSSTPNVATSNADITNDPDVAFASPLLSHSEFFLNPGSYTITVQVRNTAAGFASGEGFLRADLAQIGPPTTAPEPATLTLMATGLCGLAVVVRRRRSSVA